MSLIDEMIDEKKDGEEEKKELLCKKCKKQLPNNEVSILICENCFNEKIKETLKTIKQNLNIINENIEHLKKNVEQANDQKENLDLHVIFINKIEIDILNFESLIRKLLIDKETNERAFILNQEQANKVRELMKWTLYEVVKIEDYV